jgi:sugar phosphate permease
MPIKKKGTAKPLLLWLSYASLVGGYFLSNLVRVSSVVVMPRLAETMGMGSSLVGFISGLYFYLYALVQPFSGSLCDRRGPLLSCGSGLLLMALGNGLFALAPSPLFLGLGRALAGFGAGATFSGILVCQANAFPRPWYSLLAGISVTVGNLGGVVGVSPLGSAVDRWGRGASFSALALAALVLGLFMVVASPRDPVSVRKKRKAAGRADSGGLDPWKGFRLILASPELKALTAAWSAGLALQLTLLGLWGVPWLVDGSGLTVVAARRAMTLGGLGVMTGALLGGVVGRRFRDSTKSLALVCVAMAGLMAAFLAGASLRAPYAVMALLSFAVGLLLGMHNVLCNTCFQKIVPRQAIGSAIGAVNTVIFLFVMASQFFSGVLLSLLGGPFFRLSPAAEYLGAFLVIFGAFSAAMAPLLFRFFQANRRSFPPTGPFIR